MLCPQPVPCKNLTGPARSGRIRAGGSAASSLRRLGAAVALFVAVGVLGGGSAAAQTSPSSPTDLILSMSVVSVTERDASTEITVTAVLSDAAAGQTVVSLDLRRSPLLTPGVHRGATLGEDYTAVFESDTITIAPGSATGSTTLAIDPVYDTAIEGDEAVVLTGRTDDGRVTAATDLILEDGPYLSFPRHVYGSLYYPGREISVTIDEAVDKASSDSTVAYSLAGTEPGNDPLGLTFDPDTRQLTGTAPGAESVPADGITTRYRITARDSGGHVTTTLVSVAVVPEVCSATTAAWFDPAEQPPTELIVDCNVLLAAKDTLRGTAALNWSTATPIASWDGITEFHTDSAWIRRIELQLRGLDGTIPPVLGHLGSPASLDLVLGGDYRRTDPALENKLTGPVPPELGLPRLIVLALSYNDLSGPIPRELANLGALHSLYLHDTEVSGPIPPELGDLPLRNLSISANPGVTGHIPWQLGKNVSSESHPGLQVLNLYSNSLEGPIPWQLGRFGKVQQLALSHNRLTGAIPPELGNLGNEEADIARRTVGLYLNGNRLTGAIPPQIGGIANLTVLSLSQNQLTGAIPAELGGLSKLRSLFLRDNGLTGAIPPELGTLSELQHLVAYSNQLSGSIPTELGQLAELRLLQLDRNNLEGRIPVGLSNLDALSELYLDWNRLSGPIPARLGRLPALEVLSLACNDLQGTVPAGIGRIAALTELNVQNNPALDTSDRPRVLQRDGLSVTWTGACSEFADVEPDSVHAANINALHTAGITTGCATSPPSYCPQEPITRAQIASLLARALKLPTGTPAGFADVEPDSVHAANINALHTAGITTGCATSPPSYCPQEPITRAQIASLLARALKLPTGTPAGFADVEPDSVHAANINALHTAGITTGCATSPPSYCPQEPITRAQMASLLARALKLPTGTPG